MYLNKLMKNVLDDWNALFENKTLSIFFSIFFFSLFPPPPAPFSFSLSPSSFSLSPSSFVSLIKNES